MSTIAGTYARIDLGVSLVGQRGNRLYGIHQSNGHWVYTDTSGDSFVDTSVSPAAGNPASGVIELVFAGSYQIAVTDAGALYRNAIDTWTGWTAISVPGLPVGTTGRPGVLCSTGSALLYGNYNSSTPGEAHIWRSIDNGANWTEVLSVADARHVHTITVGPAGIYATLGDAASAGKGLYRSTDDGVNWSLLGSNRYGIDAIYQRGNAAVPDRILMEGDGSSQPHIMFQWESLAGAPNTVHGAVWPVATWGGTARGIQFTPEGHLFWISTAEGGAVGTKDGLWIARCPLFIEAVLLEDVTGATWSYGRTHLVRNYLFNRNYRISPLTFV